ncbi:cell division protein [bacterium (Candidatus Blackallbacteria) CG17_big_fil_post_rev_8_21_14_2_50_48_46]|uniref:Cell division protein n=1 Tax=bacterium (Candidatus Blackallbacteria) CG17_big_fil_post_rev_8_21_14_2_50_48_46 TaxID=2014261 RepID=A0A2M7G835_9BACT|nr:MAG: cell division protein [bacterium (Candidatus Blackallbacteria) CG18_big_fil_WC_8_21_14_2_50_49_26]PIW18249.1 MAG: cell division protein [bacterium (Candidatus Blackallbacteria) CG17_big_fil_post_rev_8_21_14_2_50_48_46]PIW50680.1 MAG: cell division protein [bacterium (Candidatus Blackallbacteria) CG13_big_fil_rev_8_21_14_2_50_49_14]
MPFDQELIASLRKALEATPDNPHLRKHLGDILMAQGDLEAAETEYRQALRLQSHDPAIRLALAEVFFKQEKRSAAQVLLEDLLSEPRPPVGAYLLSAHLMAQKGDIGAATHHYLKARELQPGLQDNQLESMIPFYEPPDEMPTLYEIAPPELPLEKVPAQDFNAVQGPLPLEKPDLDFSDIGGMQTIKEEIEIKIIHPLKHPELYAAYGKSAGGGILMYGPPGCGKTHLARATAGEVQASFLSVGINDILDMWLGQSEKNLHEIFEQARKATPCVLFFDEVDALGASRSDMRQSAGRHLINQFLTELDGIQAQNEGVLILAATNAPWHLDTAFRRPGRFDRVLFVPPPDLESREAILNLLLAGKPIEKINASELAKKTEGFSGADLKALVDRAIETRLREAIKTGTPTPLRQKDLLTALKQTRSTVKEWLTSARNYALYANQSGFYDDVLEYLKL